MLVSVRRVLFTSISVILQFLNCFWFPRMSFTVMVSFSAFAYMTSLNTVLPFRIMLNSHMWYSCLLIIRGLNLVISLRFAGFV